MGKNKLWCPWAWLMLLLGPTAQVGLCSDNDDMSTQQHVNVVAEAARAGLPKGWGHGVHEGRPYYFPIDAPERIQWDWPNVPLPSSAEVEAAAAQADSARVADLGTTKDGEFQANLGGRETELNGCANERGCGEHGICVAAACRCSDGYSGPTCTKPPDPCFYPAKVQCLGSSICVNGTCTRAEHSARGMERHGASCGGQHCRHGKCLDGACHCDAGWEGKACTDRDQCHTNPCQNGGTCFDSGDVISELGEAHAQLAKAWEGSYRCACVAGFVGDRCHCLDCGENGRCLRSGACYCKKGFTGSRCRKNVDECASNPCGKFGTCIDGVNSFTCACEPGYEGFWCEKRRQQRDESTLAPCGSSPCGQHGTCLDRRNAAGSATKYYCKCERGWTGENCDDSTFRGAGSQHVDL